MKKTINQYRRLGRLEKTVLQILAFQHRRCEYPEIWRFGKALGLVRDDGRSLTQTSIRECLSKLHQVDLLSKPNNHPVAEIHDFLIREGLKSELSQSLLEACQKYERWGSRCESLEFYLAFYTQDASLFQTALENIPVGSVPLLSPFCQKTFDDLTPEFQQHYFDFVVPFWISHGHADPDAVENLQATIADDETTTGSAPTLLTWAIASGNVALLRDLTKHGRSVAQDIEGGLGLLAGDSNKALDQLMHCLTNRKSKQSLTKLGGLPSVFGLLAAFDPESSLTPEKAVEAAGLAQRRTGSPYTNAFCLIEAALEYAIAPSDAGGLLSRMSKIASSPLDTLIAGYLAKWLNLSGDGNADISGLASAASQFASTGCLWLAAEAHALAGHSKLKTASAEKAKADKLHRQLGTKSLVDMIKPEPPWARTLAAITRMGDKAVPAASTDAKGESVSDRLIYELIHNDHYFNLDVYHQVRKGKKWSKGRKVALARLHHEYQKPQFAFLTPEDQALCRTLRHWTERGSYGYPEEYCEFDSRSGAKALIGHPRIYLPGEREQPLEITESPVQLLVRKDDDGKVEVVLHPKPIGKHEMRIEELGSHRRGITLFEAAHLELQKLLGQGLKVPASAADQVMRSVAGLASIVTVHSEVGSTSSAGKDSGDKADAASEYDDEALPSAERIDADTRIHLRMRPSGEGFRVEIRIHPLGSGGPSCVPGEGGETVLAMVDRKPVSTVRDLGAERERAANVMEQAPVLAEYMLEGWTAVLPSPIETLRLVEEIEELVDSGEVELHWPKGKSLQLAGSATESMLRVSIRRDRDWFAATGKLKVDRNLTIDMMDLIDLVADSPSRFVRLDDGRFLSLAENLRSRIRDLHSFGDGRSVKNKLRFAAVHAGLLEDLGDIKVTADAHWKKCTQRMKDADKLTLHIPRGLQADLRDYQREGVFWMMRLAAWGVGGCLADDMGLGKTIQTIALLLERAGEGPSVVIAPTSVIYNWQDELHRFAPTLTPHVLADADRGKLLESLSAGDVLLCSYGLLQTQGKAMNKIDFGTLILDEAQAIKNPSSKRSKAAKSLSADCRFVLTGTPMENHLGELWNLMNFINPGLLGSQESFQERFAVPIERDGDHGVRNQLKRLVSPFILRRTKAQVLTELPPRTETTLRIDPSAEEAAFYEAVRERAIQAIEASTEDEPTQLRVLGEIMRLRRACCHPKLVVPESEIAGSKLNSLMELIDDLRNGNHRALVFSQFVDHLSIVREAMQDRQIDHQYLDGSTPAATRKKRVQAFQSGDGDVFLISLKAGGTGLNLTAADYVIHLDPWWNPAVEDQASDRAHRIGQQRPVTIYRLILSGTIEERILELHATKRDLADSLLEGTDQSGKLSTEDLLRLIRQ